MLENGTPAEARSGNVPDSPDEQAGSSSTPPNQSRNRFPRNTRPSNRLLFVQTSMNRDFEGATPKLGAFLALRSENTNKKVNYDRFLEKLAIYVVNKLKNGDSLVEVTKTPNAKTIENFQEKNKPKELCDEDKESTVNVEMREEDTKECVKDLRLLKSNLKKLYGIVFGNCTESVQMMVRTDSEHEQKAEIFDHDWLLQKVKTIVSGLGTKLNLRVSLHDVVVNFMLLKQFVNESNEAHHTRFKSMVETLKITGGRGGIF